MSKDPSQVIRTLQGHEAVLQAELEEINQDIHILGQLNNRYHANGVPFDSNLHHLEALRQEKTVILHELSHQIAKLHNSVQQSIQLASAVAASNQHVSSYSAPAQSVVYAHGPPQYSVHGSPYHGHHQGPVNSFAHSHISHHSSYCPHGHHINALRNASTSACQHVLPSPGGVIQLNGPGGMAVTTNSSILVHSPRRVFN